MKYSLPSRKHFHPDPRVSSAPAPLQRQQNTGTLSQITDESRQRWVAIPDPTAQVLPKVFTASLCHPHPHQDSQQLKTQARTWKRRVEVGGFLPPYCFTHTLSSSSAPSPMSAQDRTLHILELSSCSLHQCLRGRG